MKDILQTAKSTKKETTMFEVGEQMATNSYVKLFIEFIESLGYEVGQPSYPGSTDIEINSIPFYIGTHNVSYESRNAYTRKTAQRKPENRFITLSRKGYGPDKTNIRVHFNKELETGKLKLRIDSAIADYNKAEMDVKNYKDTNERNTVAIAMHYLRNESIKSVIERIYIDQGQINFSFKDTASVTLLADGTFVEANFNPNKMKTPEAVLEFKEGIERRAMKFYYAVELILITSKNKLSPALIEWANKSNHQYFHTKTMSVDKY